MDYVNQYGVSVCCRYWTCGFIYHVIWAVLTNISEEMPPILHSL